MHKDKDTLLKLGVEVLQKEAEALISLAKSLGTDFIKAVELMGLPDRRVGVSGMGKSGHIARKIAATLSSTGTPSYFIHPAEASHGDLGMMGPKDVLLAISNSGTTKELTDILRYVHRHDIPVIAITHKLDSPLAKQADVCLLLEYTDEACPLGCAPTTSTTATLALGDALAMALLYARGFSVQDFNELHPGGALGQKLILVEDLMHKGESIPIVTENTSIPDTLLEMSLKGFGCTCVINDSEHIVGIITDGDLRRHINDSNFFYGTAANIMTSNPHVITSSISVSKAISIMNKYSITSLMVVSNNIPIGIIHMHDCLNFEGKPCKK